MNSPISLGVVWFSEVEYAKIQPLCQDEFDMMTYPEWLEYFDTQFAQIKSKFPQAEKVPVSVDRLLNWCQANKKEITNSAHRAEFAAFAMARSGHN